MRQATDGGKLRQAQRTIGPPDALTIARFPLAFAFVVVEGATARLVIVALAAASDVIDVIWARRIGGSRVGAVLDPVADKVFMAAAFAVVLVGGALHPIEIAGVLLRDITAAIAFVAALIVGRPTAIPARAGGKAVTVIQVLVLIAFLGDSVLLRPLAWVTAAVSVYAIYDYSREALRS